MACHRENFTGAAEVRLYAALMPTRIMSKEMHLTMPEEIFHLNVSEMVRLLSQAYVSLLKSNTPFREFPSVMLWGSPGVGKSQGVREVASRIERETGKTVVITDVRLLLFNPVDLRGIPTANADKTLSVWLKPKIFQMDESEETVNILFLDEISAAPQSVQAAAYQITLDRMVGEHRLPENCIVIAAGNRVTDRSVAYNMPKALANRLCHLEIRADPAAWHDWAVQKGLHRFVVGYLAYNPVALMRFEPSGTSLAFPTPRSWEMVSNILAKVSEDIDTVFPLVVGCIGEETARSLKTWSRLYDQLSAPEEIFAGTSTAKPRAEELRTALRSSLVEYARRHPEPDGLARSIDHACTLPWEYRKALLRDYSLIPAVNQALESNQVFRDAIRREEK